MLLYLLLECVFDTALLHRPLPSLWWWARRQHTAEHFFGRWNKLFNLDSTEAMRKVVFFFSSTFHWCRCRHWNCICTAKRIRFLFRFYTIFARDVCGVRISRSRARSYSFARTIYLLRAKRIYSLFYSTSQWSRRKKRKKKTKKTIQASHGGAGWYKENKKWMQIWMYFIKKV